MNKLSKILLSLKGSSCLHLESCLLLHSTQRFIFSDHPIYLTVSFSFTLSYFPSKWIVFVWEFPVAYLILIFPFSYLASANNKELFFVPQFYLISLPNCNLYLIYFYVFREKNKKT